MVRRFVRPFVRFLFGGSFVRSVWWFILLFVRPVVRSFNCSFGGLFFRSFVRSVVRSFV